GAKKKQNSLQAHFFSTLISPLVSLFLRLEIGGSSYFKSDQLAAELNSNPHALAKALWKLHSYSLTTPLEAPIATSHLWMVSPLARKDWTSKFRIQPSIDRRIKNLVGYYPI
ncbi:MAG: hypothetical protein KDD34_05195, partial [Bdellovibrionales bacterium]|nr:hypothetical protein [Bdellovibrionales bacterium]